MATENVMEETMWPKATVLDVSHAKAGVCATAVRLTRHWQWWSTIDTP